MRIRSTSLAVAVLVPGLLVMLAFAASEATAVFTGQAIFWSPRAETLSEAVGMRDRAEVIRQVMSGADINAPYDTHGLFRDGEYLRLTPLEAAVKTREPYMLSLLLAYGARLDASLAAHLQCVAREHGARDIENYLAARFGAAVQVQSGKCKVKK